MRKKGGGRGEKKDQEQKRSKRVEGNCEVEESRTKRRWKKRMRKS